MIRLFLPALLVTVAAWVMLYGVSAKMRKQGWVYVRNSLVAVSIGLGLVVFVILIFMGLGSIHHV